MDENDLNRMLIQFKCPVLAIELIWPQKRMETLNNWTLAQPSAREMAEAGFYCPNAINPGEVKCFLCSIELDGWEPTDDPWEEHRKRAVHLNPPCEYVELGKKPSEFLLQDYIKILQSVMLQTVKERCVRQKNLVLAAHAKKRNKLKRNLQKIGVPR